MRICSFLPSATEIVCALGLENDLAGVTHECDHPPEVRTKPVVVYTRLNPSSAPAEIDRQVNEAVRRGESLYRVDVEKLKEIQPDLIITQDLCHVCAASSHDLAAALAVLHSSTRVLSLSPRRLLDIWGNIISVGEATDRQAEAATLIETLKQRVQAARRAVSGIERPLRVLCLEWLDPPFVAGHWVPEMVEIAGGIDVMGREGEPGFRTEWKDIFAAAPEVIVIMPCGYDLERTAAELRKFSFPDGWNQVPAAVNGRVFAVRANSYFSRPGPRIATGVELLARAIHTPRLSVAVPSGAMVKVGRFAFAA
jgi:iron complex transport system substrate-binding protein